MEFTNIVIISGPSGAGEDSVIEGLQEIAKVNRVITTTTRPRREGETEGSPYHYISVSEFEEKIERGLMAEWAREYNDNLYGVTFKELARVQNLDGLCIWKLEYKGVMTAKDKFPDIMTILITAPLEVLESRIRKRDNATDSHVNKRMEYTKNWLKHADIYDYTVENKEGLLGETISEVMDILKKEKYL